MLSRCMSETRHSASVLTDLRDDWWSTDYLELIAQRLDLASVSTVADIGCGHGHWGHRLLPHLGKNAQLEGKRSADGASRRVRNCVIVRSQCSKARDVNIGRR